MGISFDQMNANDIIKKMRCITNDPQTIWDAFSKHYGKGFFNYPIEKEYGISPETHDKLISRFDKKIAEFRILSEK